MTTPNYPRVLFVLKAGNTSGGYTDSTSSIISNGLANSAVMLSTALAREGVPVKVVQVQDNSTIHAEVVNFDADIAVIEAFWVVPDKFDELYSVDPSVRYIVRNHSEIPFLSNEGVAFDWMLQYITKPNVIMASNSSRMHRDTTELVRIANPQLSTSQVFEKLAYLPNFYLVEQVKTSIVDPSKEAIDIGCFGAIRPFKNQVTQAIAAIEFANYIGKNLHFHINSKVEMGGDEVLKNLTLLFSHFPDHQLVQHDWMPHSDFYTLIGQMDIVMQVSFSETFNIIAADAISQGVLAVTSPEVRWTSPDVQAAPTSSESVVKTLINAWSRKQNYPTWNPSIDGLLTYNSESIYRWLKYLRDYHKPE
jgi:hypothetical protein